MINNLLSINNQEITFIITHLQKNSFFFTDLIAQRYLSSSIDKKFIAEESIQESLKSLMTSSCPYDETQPLISRKAFLNKLLKNRIHDQIKKRTHFIFQPLIIGTSEPNYHSNAFDYVTKEDRKRIKRKLKK